MNKIIILIAATFLTLILPSCSRSNTNINNGYTKKTIVINNASNYTNIITQVIMNKDLLNPFLPNDVSIRWTSLETGLDIREALVAGRVDIGVVGTMHTITGIENGLPIRIISNQGAGFLQVISKNRNINSIFDLNQNSKITITSMGSYTHLAFSLRSKELFNNSMLFNDNFVTVPNSIVLGLIQSSSDYDAFILSFPTCYLIPDNVQYHIIDDLTQTTMKYDLGTYLVTSESFYRDNPVIINAFRKASEHAIELITNNRIIIAELLSEIYEVRSDIIADVIRQCPPKLEISESGYNNIAELMHEMKFLSRPPKKFSQLPNYIDIPKEL